MPGRQVAVSRRPRAQARRTQARRLRRLEVEGPSLRVAVGQGAAWVSLNGQRMPGLVLMVACMVALAFLFVDPRFFVYQAEVTGTRLLAPDQVYAASGVDTLSIFFVSPRAVKERLLANLPGLQSAQVALGLPARLRIHVQERNVRYVWEVGGQGYLTDDRGTVLGVGNAPPDALLIRAGEGPAPSQGQQLDPAVLSTVSALSQLLGNARTFEYAPHFGVGWRSKEGWPVYFGVGGDLPEKVAVMQSMMSRLAGEGISPQFLDVGVPNRPYYR